MILFCAAFAMAAIAATGVPGCASANAGNRESLLSAAGFHPSAPSTPKQHEIYDGLPDYTMQRGVINGKVLYAYKDPRQGVVYVGGENEYQQYKQLGIQQSITQDNLNAAQMNQSTMMGYGAWGPRGPVY